MDIKSLFLLFTFSIFIVESVAIQNDSRVPILAAKKSNVSNNLHIHSYCRPEKLEFLRNDINEAKILFGIGFGLSVLFFALGCFTLSYPYHTSFMEFLGGLSLLSTLAFFLIWIIYAVSWQRFQNELDNCYIT